MSAADGGCWHTKRGLPCESRGPCRFRNVDPAVCKWMVDGYQCSAGTCTDEWQGDKPLHPEPKIYRWGDLADADVATVPKAGVIPVLADGTLALMVSGSWGDLTDAGGALEPGEDGTVKGLWAGALREAEEEMGADAAHSLCVNDSTVCVVSALRVTIFAQTSLRPEGLEDSFRKITPRLACRCGGTPAPRYGEKAREARYPCKHAGRKEKQQYWECTQCGRGFCHTCADRLVDEQQKRDWWCCKCGSMTPVSEKLCSGCHKATPRTRMEMIGIAFVQAAGVACGSRHEVASVRGGAELDHGLRHPGGILPLAARLAAEATKAAYAAGRSPVQSTPGPSPTPSAAKQRYRVPEEQPSHWLLPPPAVPVGAAPPAACGTGPGGEGVHPQQGTGGSPGPRDTEVTHWLDEVGILWAPYSDPVVQTLHEFGVRTLAALRDAAADREAFKRLVPQVGFRRKIENKLSAVSQH
eukprot:TRINITY_DN50499_c0_g1_i1.p1 TRINITY_DN50499_c0_g1~~TRINITY_DN50499_c0_g1_i1.p1  ORF type:complete len:491 (+),score=73.88 TRINITY_DN50499_c0_g1_i1:71-1474(+)